MIYKIIIDQKVVDEYNEYYFKKHPRAKNKPIERPIMPTLNQIMVLQRVRIADLKAKYKDFGIWLIHKLKYENLKIDKFEFEAKVYMPSKRRFDLDNVAGGIKMICDSFTETGFIIDDSSTHMVKLSITGDVDKTNPRTEYTIRVLN